jgi:hypothetical protein
MTRRLLPQILDGVDADDCADTPETWTKLVSDRIRKRLPITRRVLASMFNAAFITAMVVIAAMGCAAAQQRPMTTPAAPDTDAILRLVGRFGSAHACPISETLALTSAHVADLRPFDPGHPMYPLVWSDGFGHDGNLMPVISFRHRDLALMESDVPFARWYEIAAEAPAPGERLVALGFDWRKVRRLYAPRVFTAELLRIVARTLIFVEGTERGASGSCVLNARGEVVGINAWLHEADDGGRGGVAVGVWGQTFGERR